MMVRKEKRGQMYLLPLLQSFSNNNSEVRERAEPLILRMFGWWWDELGD